MDRENNESPKSYKRIKLWSDADTQLLLDLYGCYLFQIGPMKKFKNKKEMWEQISKKIHDKSAKQCEERYKTVLRRKNAKIDKKINPGKRIKKNNFIALEPQVQIKIENDEENNECTKTTLTLEETLWEIAKNSEVGKERRHKEKMEAMGKITSLLQKILHEKDKLF